MTIFKAHHKIIRITDHPAGPFLLGLHHALKPQIQHEVQIDVGQHGRDYSTLWCAALRMDHLPILFQYACLQPFADQVYERAILDSFSEHPFQPGPLDVLEETSDTLPTSETSPPESE